MTLQVLVLDHHAPQYYGHLAPRFPAVTFHATDKVAEAQQVIGDVEVIMGLGHHLPPPLLKAAPKLKWVQALTTGTETLTAPGVLPPDVILTSTRGVHGPQMTELAFMMMIALMRDFRRMQRNQAEGKWDQWGQPILDGKTIVIVGLGLLAEHLAERCKLFGMTVIGVSEGRTKGPLFRRGRFPQAAGRGRGARRFPAAAGAVLTGDTPPHQPAGDRGDEADCVPDQSCARRRTR